MKDPMVRLLTALLMFLTIGMAMKPHVYTVGFVVHADEAELIKAIGEKADCKVKQIAKDQISDHYDLILELRHDTNLPEFMGDPSLFSEAQYCAFSEVNPEGISAVNCGSEVTGSSWSVLQADTPALVVEVKEDTADRVSEIIRRIRDE